jgi:WD40 repeat protein
MMCRFVLMALVAVMICGVAAVGPPAQGASVVKECVYVVPEGVEVSDTFFPQAKGTSWACMGRRGDQWFVVLDGVALKPYDRVGGSAFSPDGRRFAYVAHLGDDWFVVLDGVEQKVYDECSQLTFSPDGKRFAYAAVSGDHEFMVVDGAEQKPYDDVGRLPLDPSIDPMGLFGDAAFSPDSKHFAYVALSEDKQFVVFDGAEQKPYDGIQLSSFVFSPDSKRFAYTARAAGKEFIVLDGVEQKPYDEAHHLRFSPDSARFAYIAKSGGKSMIVVDGEEQEWYDIARAPRFSPDSKRCAYSAQAGDEGFIVVNGVKQKSYQSAAGIDFSPDSKRIAHMAKLDGQAFMVVDGVEHERYYTAGTRWCFSPDSRRYAYVATSDPYTAWFFVVDGEKQKGYKWVETPTFSADSKLFAYEAGLGDKHLVVLDGVEQEHMDMIRWLQPDGSDPCALVWYGWQGQCYEKPVDGKMDWQPGSKLYRFTAR